jgi:hypothetical protein
MEAILRHNACIDSLSDHVTPRTRRGRHVRCDQSDRLMPNQELATCDMAADNRVKGTHLFGACMARGPCGRVCVMRESTAAILRPCESAVLPTHCVAKAKALHALKS